jgi:dihydrofolate synthase/folylpolyglutamate synthase
MIRDFVSALDYLFPRTTQIKFGLATTEHLLRSVGDPQQMFPTILIGGTNGKGSVATLTAGALQLAGVRTGLYTSPHLQSFRERIRVDGAAISEEAVVTWTRQLQPAIEETGATFFEATTAIGLAHFAAREVDVAVVEVGLGGRLDSTNILQPLVSAITHVALDHQKYLGETIEEIVCEKAGIAKRGRPFVIGEPDPRLAALLRDAGARIVSQQAGNGDYLPVVIDPECTWTHPLGVLGPHQRRNAAVAAGILALLPPSLRPDASTIAEAFAHARVPGRFDRRGKWLYDVAHNPDGVNALVAAVGDIAPPRPVHALVSILGDKAWSEMLVALDCVVDAGVLTVAPSADTRRWDLAWLERWLADHDRPRAQARWRLIPDFTTALQEVERGAGTILVTGSFHTVGDVMQARGEVVL